MTGIYSTSGRFVDPDEEKRAPRVALGSQVEIEVTYRAGDVERMSLIVVPDQQADYEAGLLGTSTPLARALLEHEAGAVVRYRQGDIVRVRVVSVADGHVPDSDAAAEREAVIREAIAKSDLADAIQLALTVDVKWGDYDPEGIVPKEDDEEEE